MDITKISLIRRNGTIVPWKEDKIVTAVAKAFDELGVSREDGPEHSVARFVSEQVHTGGNALIHVEDVQDLVQQELMSHGHYKVAEAYILYRAKKNEERLQRRREDLPLPTVYPITVNCGDSEYEWLGEDLRARIEYAIIGLDLIYSAKEIEGRLLASVFSGIKQEDLKKTILLNARMLIERDADFSKFAGRLFMTYVYEESLGWDIIEDGIAKLKKFHREGFEKYLARGVEIKRLDPAMLSEYKISKLANALDPIADLGFDYQGMQTVYDRYLIIDKTQKPAKRIEVPQFFWMRVAMGIHLRHGANPDKVIKLYKLYKDRRFCSSTPTLFNSGSLRPQMSSCYLYKVDDSIESIMQRGISENAYLSKWSGGLGGSWTSVRGTGSFISGTNGESQGVIPFLKMHNDLLCAVNQGGKRKGAGCAYLETWHSDIEDFLELRKNTGDERRRTHDMNTSNWIPDLFMERVYAKQDWTLFHSNEVPELHDLYGSDFKSKYLECEDLAKTGKIWSKKIPALDLWKKMLSSLFETGHPWITFKDPCNVRSPQDHVGVVHSSNLCTEITLNTSEKETAVCNLGSVVLDNHINSQGKIDVRKLKQTVKIAIEALDNVIDTNFYPTEAAKTANKLNRPVGLGVMGLQNVFYMQNIAFDSDEAVAFNDQVMELISYYAIEASSELAEERGCYETYKGSKWDRELFPIDTIDLLQEQRGFEIAVNRETTMDWDVLRAKVKKSGMRNSNLLAIAPTATIALIMGSCPCIEPMYKNLYVKSNLSGDFVVLNTYLVKKLKEQELWDDTMRDNLKYLDGELKDLKGIPSDIKEVFKTAFEVSYEKVLEAAAVRQKWIDQSQSVNLWLPEPSMPVMSKMYKKAWELGLKTTYYLRTLQASNIEKSTVNRDFKSNEPVKACRIDDPDCESCQ